MGTRPYYGVIGNGETCAFVSPIGNIEWLCLPQYDAQIVYSKSLARLGDSLSISFNENGNQLQVQKSSQEYEDRTGIVRTTLKFKSVSIEMYDFMPWPEPEAMDAEKRLIFKIIKITNRSNMETSISIKVRSSIGSKYHREVGENRVVSSNSYAMAITFLGSQLEKIKFKPRETREIPVIIVYGKTSNEVKRTLSKKRMLDHRMQIKKCREFWKNWIDKGNRFEATYEYDRAYYMSLIAIKLMTFEKTGAIMAAATTSLPASPIGTHAWDYRFMWIRDAYYACRALLATGHFDEVKRQLSLLYRLQEKNGHWISPFYTIDSRVPGDEITIELGNETLRLNNDAKNQLQLDSEGSVLYATYLYYLYSKDTGFLRKNWNKIKAAANWTVKNHNKEENGIWEFRHKTAHWVYGKVMCYVAIDAALKIADIMGISAPKKWEKVRLSIKNDVLKNSWSAHRGAFLQTYDRDSSVDISVLALEDCGLVRASDKRMTATVKLIESKLNSNGGIKRNEDAQLPFYFSTLWLASHYIRAGKEKRAQELVNICLDSSTDLMLCAEHFDALNRIQYGNFPQTFSHSMLIERIMEIERKSFEIDKIFEFINHSLHKAVHYDKEEIIRWSEKVLDYKRRK